MNPALWGALSALSLGSADFAARFSARALGADVVFLAVLAVGSLLLSLWVWLAGPVLVWDLSGAWLLGLNGVATAVMTVLLYAGLARGPVSVVAPIVAAHPVLVLGFWVALGASPTALAWLAMAATIVGVVLVARAGAGVESRYGRDPREFRVTLLIAGGACLTYTVVVVAGQAAVPIYGELQTLWLGRLLGLGFMLVVFAARRKTPIVPRRWWPFLIAQGCLDAGGYLFLFAGSHGEGREVAAVTGSAFGAVTTLLARFVLKEAINRVQWAGIALVFAGILVLSMPG